MSYAFMRPHFRKNKSKTKDMNISNEEYEKAFHKTIKPEEPITKEMIEKVHQKQNPALTIQVYNSICRRIWNLIKNPFTYIFNGRIEW